MSPWHEPLPEEWSAVESAIEVQLAPPPTIVAPIAASAEGRTRRQTKDAPRRAIWHVELACRMRRSTPN